MLISIIIPVYNAEKYISECLDSILSQSFTDFELLLIDDGSKDKTWEKIEEAHVNFKYVKGLKLAGNVGHQNALLAGLLYAKDFSDATVSIDADLQDDVNAIENMTDLWDSGCDIVYGVQLAFLYFRIPHNDDCRVARFLCALQSIFY